MAQRPICNGAREQSCQAQSQLFTPSWNVLLDLPALHAGDFGEVYHATSGPQGKEALYLSPRPAMQRWQTRTECTRANLHIVEALRARLRLTPKFTMLGLLAADHALSKQA